VKRVEDRDFEKRRRWFLQKADELEAMDADDCDSEEAKITFLAARAQELALYRKSSSATHSSQ
jgi:hypothetical protein